MVSKKKRNSNGPRIKNKLDSIYSNVKNAASFGTAADLASAGKVSLQKAREYLEGVDAHTLHSLRRLRFKRNRYIVPGMNYLFEGDLCDMRHLSRKNNGFAYILNVIDVFSKYAWSIALKDKSATSVLAGLKKIFAERKPKYFQTDLGLEFRAGAVQNYLKENGIKFLTTKNEIKAAVIERFNKTVKTKMHKYFTHNGTQKYVDILQDLIFSYNHKKHSAIGQTPASVSKTNEQQVFDFLYSGLGRYKRIASPEKKHKFAVGQHVRISRPNQPFVKAYEGTWSMETFKIVNIIKKERTLYELSDWSGQKLDARFYTEELQRVKIDENTQFRIDKIVRTIGKGRSKRLVVKWSGYPSSYNSIIYERDLVRLGKK
jgi:hypothetical protein